MVAARATSDGSILDGNLVLVGRAGDMYIRGGYNVYPLEVENVLAEHPAVDQVSVIGVPAPVIGEIGVAFVVLDPAGAREASDGELRAWCRDRLADYKAPDRFVRVRVAAADVDDEGRQGRAACAGRGGRSVTQIVRVAPLAEGAHPLARVRGSSSATPGPSPPRGTPRHGRRRATG